jgi:hypothetical protein
MNDIGPGVARGKPMEHGRFSQANPKKWYLFRLWAPPALQIGVSSCSSLFGKKKYRRRAHFCSLLLLLCQLKTIRKSCFCWLRDFTVSVQRRGLELDISRLLCIT